MKRFYYIWAGAFAFTFIMSLSACVKDLDAYPNNPEDFTSENAYGNDYEGYLRGLAYLYCTFSECYGGLEVDDNGSSELIRAYWNIQECSTDACKFANQDSWTNDINCNTWSVADNAASYGVYCRAVNGIGFVNEFLRQTEENKLESRGCDASMIARVNSLRAEARFIRALQYYYLIDVFGDSPFITEDSPVGAFSPEMKSRSYIFDYIESELKDLVSDSSAMPDARSNYPRADKGAVWGLLSRLYLNAEIFNSTVDASGNVVSKGEPRWADCKKACEEVFGLGYDLCDDYFDLFRGDNGENPEAFNEFLFALDYDETSMNSWGGTTYFVYGCFAASDDKDAEGMDMYSLGVGESWANIRMPSDYVFRYFGVSIPEDGYNEDGTYKGGYNAGDGYEYVDKRASQFFIKNHSADMYPDIYNFQQGFSFYKYNNIPHDMTREEFAPTAATYTWLSKTGVDYPVIRLAEIYLTYAEACLETSESGKGLPFLNEVRERAGLDPLDEYDMEDVQRERAVELAWEAVRRTDLIRWDMYNTDRYLWNWKGGTYEGRSFPDYRLVFDFPGSELNVNENLSHKPGYMVEK